MKTDINKKSSKNQKKTRRLKLENSVEHAMFLARKKINYEYMAYTQHTGLTPRQHVLLKNIQLHDSYNISQLVTITQLDKSNLAVLASKLLEKGYINITKHPKDKRHHIMSITFAGNEALKEYEEQALKAEKRIRSVMSKGEAKRLLYYLNRFNLSFTNTI